MHETKRSNPDEIFPEIITTRTAHCVHLILESGETKRLNFIECPHGSKEDLDFIFEAMGNCIGKHTLFVEQGSPKQKDYYTERLKKIADDHADIRRDFREEPSIWEKLMAAKDPFAQASDYIITRTEGRVVNMDLEANLSQEAINFLFKESSPEFALEIIYDIVRLACFDHQETIPKIMKIILPQIPAEDVDRACWIIYWTYHRIDRLMDRSKLIRKRLNFLRERYMRSTLEKYASDRDYVLCHPNHAREIKRSRDQIAIPEEPKPLFRFE
ncbi:MAG: hypothetical protein WC788_01000 [Candidatus Paceibacterota bacterium]|jgi:hypothetical protein